VRPQRVQIQKKANEFEENVIKIGVKIFYLIHNGTILLKDVLVADKPVREALELFARCRNHVADRSESSTHNRRLTVSINIPALKERLAQVSGHIRQAGMLLSDLLRPHLTPKSIQRIQDIVDYISNADVLFKVLMDRELMQEVYELVSAGEHYSQFHFYIDD